MSYQKQLEDLSQKISTLFEEKEKAREHSLLIHRQIIKLCANAIRLMHRKDFEQAEKFLSEAGKAVESIFELSRLQPDVYYGGFIQSAQKEYAEARCFQAVISGKPLPAMETLKIDAPPYLNGLGEAIGELRRYILDHLREGSFDSVESTLEVMDEIYYVISSVDYPDALTLGLRRTVDIARSLIEKTRGELTTALEHHRLEKSLRNHQLNKQDCSSPTSR